MINSDFQAAMTEEEILDGEARHIELEQSRRLAMAAGLTKSSVELREVWELAPETYKTLLQGAVASYEQNLLVEELLRGAIARLTSVIDWNDVSAELHQRCVDIAVKGRGNEELSNQDHSDF